MTHIDKLKPKVLRSTAPLPESLRKLKRQPLYFVLDNIMDTYNTGTIFRLADALAIQQMYLCGLTEVPPNSKVKKASINTWQWVNWEYHKKTIDAIKKLRTEVPGIKVIGIEQNAKSIPYDKADYAWPVALVVGHETKGVSSEVLELCDCITEIPMFGFNVSLNVIVALAVVAYKSVEHNA